MRIVKLFSLFFVFLLSLGNVLFDVDQFLLQRCDDRLLAMLLGGGSDILASAS
ncbi:hypothetical protein C4J97_4491 [Pseudomonas orientalis]|nr:hypothetical protein C4J97_4491 [Pseudomonas orientalis]